jgi:hypothetical protein
MGQNSAFYLSYKRLGENGRHFPIELVVEMRLYNNDLICDVCSLQFDWELKKRHSILFTFVFFSHFPVEEI